MVTFVFVKLTLKILYCSLMETNIFLIDSTGGIIVGPVELLIFSQKQRYLYLSNM